MGLISKNRIKSFIAGGILPLPLEYKNICEFGNIVVCKDYVYLSVGDDFPSFVGNRIKEQGDKIVITLDDTRIQGWAYDLVNVWKEKFPSLKMDFEEAKGFDILAIYKTDITFDNVNKYIDFRKTYLNLGLDKKPEEVIRTYGTYK